MKKEIKKSILFVAMMVTMIASATDIPSLKANIEVKKTTVSFVTVKKGQRLVIKDANGIILYKEKIKVSGNYAKEFDLTSLPIGDYVFELEKELEIQIIPFKVSLEGVEFIKEKQESFFKPFVRFKDNQILLSRLSVDNKPLNVEIYYNSEDGLSERELIYSETIENKKVIERIYTLLKEKKGNYKIVLTLDGREFSDSLSI